MYDIKSLDFNSKIILKNIIAFFLILLAFIILLPFDYSKRFDLVLLLFTTTMVLVLIPYFYKKSKKYDLESFESYTLKTKEHSFKEFNTQYRVYYLIFLLKSSILDLYSDIKAFMTSNPLLILGYCYLGAKMLAYNILLIAVPKSQLFINKGLVPGEERYFTGLLIADVLGTAWDCLHFLDIAKYGYTNLPKPYAGTWVFGHFFHFLIRIVDEILNFINSTSFGVIFDWIGIRIAAGNFYALAGVLVANLFSFIAMYLFYKIAFYYITKNKSESITIKDAKIRATIATAFFVFFPTNFAYMTGAYSESVFTTFCLLGFYLFIRAREKVKKGQNDKEMYIASLCAGIAFLTRFPGGLLFLIFGLICAYDCIRYFFKKDWKQCSLAFDDGLKISIFFVIPLLWYNYLIANKVNIAEIQKSIWNQQIIFPYGGLNAFIDQANPNIVSLFELWSFLFLIIVLVIASAKYSWYLTLYSFIFLGLYISITGMGSYSIVRYIGTIWPAFLIFSEMKSKETKYIVIALLIFFYSLGVYDLARWSLRIFWG